MPAPAIVEKPPATSAPAAGPSPDPLGAVSGLATVVVTLLVVLSLGALIAVVVAAGMSRPAGSADTIVFTVPAPYHPGVQDAAKYVPQNATATPVGNWTPARGREIALRALHWLGWPYSWDAGNAAGPTYGRAVDAASRNDAHVLGFDCSGLVMYALGPWLALDHAASSQYAEAGHLHPGLDQLQVGDLIFWSSDGTVGGIGHVAVYIGGGRVVQAPQSGSVIDIVPLDQVEPGRIGVTRPLS